MAPPWLECFAFLDVCRVKKASSPKKAADKRQNVELSEACSQASRRRFSLLARSAAIAWQLVPVSASIAVDFLVRRKPKHTARDAQRLRKSLEVLGPAFVKLGQALAAREDILSDEMAIELRKLCDQVPRFPAEQARQVLFEELGSAAPTIPEDAIAAASLGQVYRITLHGQQYALKVQRPGIGPAIAADVVILKKLARCARRIFRLFCAATVDLERVTQMWAQTMWHELDYIREATSMESMKTILEERIAGMVVPKVNWQLTSTRVLSTEWINGAKVTEDISKVSAQHIKTGVEAFTAMILDVGLVHADPHAGNMIITAPDNKVCLLDFGMVIEIPPSHRKAWAQCVIHLVQGNHEATLDDLIDIGFFPPDCPRDAILPVMSKIWAKLVECGSNIQKRKQAVAACNNEILTFVRKFKFDLPDYYIALIRALVTLEGIALAADCNFDIFHAAFPIACRILSSSACSAIETKAVAGALLAAGKTIFHAKCSAALSRCMSRRQSAIVLMAAVGLGAVLTVRALPT